MLQETVHGCLESGICLDEQAHSNSTHHGGPIDDQKYSEEEILKLMLDTKSQKEEFNHFSAISWCHEHKKCRKDQEGDQQKKRNDLLNRKGP